MTWRRVLWVLVIANLLVSGGAVWLVQSMANERYHRDVMRMAFNHNDELLHEVERGVGAERDTLAQKLASDTVAPPSKPYLVVSINDHRLWYRQDDHTIYTTRVATGSGKELVLGDAGQAHWKFETPRGRLVVESKETDPVWVPPDWHYIEIAQKKRLGVIHLSRKQVINIAGGAKVTVVGNDVVTQYPDGRIEPFEVKEGHEIVVNKNVIVPPFGTNQRKYTGTLGVNRLYLGDGYGIHGTDEPASIGHSASHGCVRVHNEDIETLYRMVPIGTVVYIY